MKLKPRAWLVLFLALLSGYLLVPTFFGFSKYEDSSRVEAAVPWYVRLFPRKTIHLGLDLRGGIYVELEIVQEDAVRHRADLLATEIERFMEKEPFKPDTVTRVALSGLTFHFKDGSTRDQAGEFLNREYRDVLVEGRSNRTETTLTYDLIDSVKDYSKEQAVRQALETIRNRIDRYGVTEPTISRVGANKITVELPGIKDPDRAIALIQRSGKLEFKLIDESVPAAQIGQWVQEARASLGLVDGFTEDQVAKINEALKDKIPDGDEILYEVQHDPVTHKVVGGIPYLLKAKSEVTGEMLRNAQVNIQNNEPYVSLSFNNIGTRLFATLTKENIGKRLAIILDGTVSKAPVIQSEIPSGEAQITLGFGTYQDLLREAEDLALVLREGALPASLKELSKNVVGPSLGRDSIERGIKTTLVAALLIIVFMIAYYKLSGALADGSLLLNLLLILAALSLFGATLTLPGIAGIVLTIGMAVDANVLIFERIKEELKGGKSPRGALEAGYKNAMSAILDSNITTFLSGLVLYQFGTGPIRGFAVTLMIGIVTTLFTAIVITRQLQDGVMSRRERISI